MNTSIFRSEAPRYWAAGYSVLPIEPNSKIPAKGLTGWSGYCNNFPAIPQQEKWMRDYPNHGIGLCLGTEIEPGFRIGAIDVDRDELVELSQAIIGHTPSHKRGKKGCTFFVKTVASEKISSTAIKTANKGLAVDILTSSKQTVLPPSLHPEIGNPYYWTGKPLLEVAFLDLPLFTKRHLKVLKCAIESEHIDTLRQGEGTHDATLRFVAQMLRAGAEETEIIQAITVLLPKNYSGNTLKELPNMIKDAKEKGFNDNPEIDKTISLQIVNSALQAGVQLFNNCDRAYASTPVSSGGILTLPIMGGGFKRWLRNLQYRQEGRTLTQSSLSDAIATLEAQALFDSPSITVWNRIGELNNSTYIDLGSRDGLVVKITGENWSVCAEHQIKFVRTSGQIPLPLPQSGGSLRTLQRLLNLKDNIWRLLIAFLIAALKPTGPYFGLIIEGAQGSGKSFLCSVIKSLIDPNEADRLRLPDNERDLAIHAQSYRLLSYDNASGMRAIISDALCVVATGGGISTRKLYTDNELEVLSASRPFIINGITGYAKRPDLLERAIYLKLEPMESGQRKTESELLEDFRQIQPMLLGALYNAVSSAMRNFTTTPTPNDMRMADAGRWISAAEEALNVEQGSLLEAIRESQYTLTLERISEDPLVLALQSILQNDIFEGFVGELHSRLTQLSDRNLPKTPAHLSSALERLRPAMSKAGIQIDFLERTNRGKRIRIIIENPIPRAGADPNEF